MQTLQDSLTLAADVTADPNITADINGVNLRASITSAQLFATLSTVNLSADVSSVALFAEVNRLSVDFFEVDNASHVHTATSPVATRHRILAPANAAHVHTATAPVILRQGITLAPANASHGHTATSPTVATEDTLTPSNASHGHTATAPAISVLTTIQPSDASHGHTATAPAISVLTSLQPSNASHGHTATAPAISVLTALQPSNASHGHTATEPVLTRHRILAPADAGHGHTATAPAISVLTQIQPSNASHVHTAISPVLTPQAGGGVSDEVQAVFDRMAALTQTEQDAIEVFVDGNVADGNWDMVKDCWCPALNTTDYKTAFKLDSAPLVEKGTGTHTAGQGYAYNAGGQHTTATFVSTLFGADFQYGAVAYQDVGTVSTANTDYYGAIQGANESYARTRANSNNNDWNIRHSHNGLTPRPSFQGRIPDGTIVSTGGTGNGQVWIFNHQVPVYETVSRTESTHPAAVFGWNGRNENGTPGSNTRDGAWSFFALVSEAGFDTITETRLAELSERILQLLRDLGVTGVPV